MAAVWCNKMVNLYRFRGILGQHYLSRLYDTHCYDVSKWFRFNPRCEGYSQSITRIIGRNPHFVQSKVLGRSFVKSAHGKKTKEYRINNAIKAKHVRLIDQDGKNLGVVTLKEALEKGNRENVMVVEVGQSSETVCKLISQQQLYEKIKEEKKKHFKTSKMKEIKVTGKISEHDLHIKLKKIVEFLQDRDSVKVFVAHRRLQNTSIDDKKGLIDKIAEQVSDVGCLQGEAKVVGNGVRAIFVPHQRK